MFAISRIRLFAIDDLPVVMISMSMIPVSKLVAADKVAF